MDLTVPLLSRRQLAFTIPCHVIFPSFGPATYAARPRRLTDACFIAADQRGSSLRAKGMLFPSQANILETEVMTAMGVAEYMFEAGLARAERPRDIRAWIEGQLYRPQPCPSPAEARP